MKAIARFDFRIIKKGGVSIYFIALARGMLLDE